MHQDVSKLTVEEKAELFDALFSCERIRVLGYACNGPKGLDGPIRHMGVEFWKSYGMPDDDREKYGRDFDYREKFLEFLYDLKDGKY